MPTSGCLNNKHLFSDSSEGWKAGMRCQHVWFLMRPLVLTYPYMAPRETEADAELKTEREKESRVKGAQEGGRRTETELSLWCLLLEGHQSFSTSSEPNYLLEDQPPSNQHRGLALQFQNCGGTPFSPQQLPVLKSQCFQSFWLQFDIVTDCVGIFHSNQAVWLGDSGAPWLRSVCVFRSFNVPRWGVSTVCDTH